MHIYKVDNVLPLHNYSHLLHNCIAKGIHCQMTTHIVIILSIQCDHLLMKFSTQVTRTTKIILGRNVMNSQEI